MAEPFNPDDYLAQGAPKAFNPDAYLATPSPPPGLIDDALDFAGRYGGLSLRAGAKGVLGLPAVIAESGRGIVNLPAGIRNSLPARAIERAISGEKPASDMDPTELAIDADKAWKYPLPNSVYPAVDEAFNNLGMSQPNTPAERVFVDAASGGVEALSGAALARLARVPGAVQSAVQSAGQRIAAMLADQPVSQTVAGMTGGGAAGTTREAGGGPLAQLAAALLGGVVGGTATTAASAASRGVAAAAQPLTQAGREQIAVAHMLSQSTDPQNLLRNIDAGMAPPLPGQPGRRVPGSPVSTGTAARDPGLLITEAGMASDAAPIPGGGASPAATFKALDAERDVARSAALGQLSPGAPQTADTRGRLARALIQQEERAAAGEVSRNYQAIDPQNTTSIPVYSVGRHIHDVADATYGPGSGNPPVIVQQVISEIEEAAQAGRNVNWRWLQGVRSRLMNAAGMASVSGDRNAASALRDMANGLDDAVDQVVQRGGVGFTQQQQQAWETARRSRVDKGQRYEIAPSGARASEDILATTQFGPPSLPDANVSSRLLASPADLRQAISAVERNPQSRAALTEHLRQQFMEDVLLKTQSQNEHLIPGRQAAAPRMLSGNSFLRYIENNREVADILFDNPAHRQNLETIINDFRETGSAAAAGKAKGSPTAQNLSVSALMSRVSQGIIDPNSQASQLIPGLESLAKFFYAGPENAMRQILLQAATDPAFAATLIRRAAPNTVEDAARFLNTTAPQRLMASARGATVRQLGRTAEQSMTTYGDDEARRAKLAKALEASK
jgi:hypothetical protein